MPRDLFNRAAASVIVNQSEELGYCNIVEPVADSDCIALTVRPLSTTTVDIFRVENAAGTSIYFKIGIDGLVELGTISAGVWQGTPIADSYVASSSTWNAKQTAYTNLSTFGGLANASGWLHNDGAGTFAYSIPTKTDVGLSNVENTALSTWAGSTNVTTLGTITTGVWSGTAIAHSALSGLTSGDPHTQYAVIAPSTSARNVIRPSSNDLVALTLQDRTAASNQHDIFAIKNTGGTVKFSVGFDAMNLLIARCDLPLYFNGDSSLAGVGTITMTYNAARTTGSINTSSSSGYDGGSIATSGGASAAGGSITTSNGGGAINTTGSGSIQFGVAATRTTLNGSGSAVTNTLPALTGTILGATSPTTTADYFCTSTTTSGGVQFVNAASAKTTLSLNNVENTALSTWAGSTNVATVGTVGTGTWQGTKVGLAYGGTNADLSATGGANKFLAQTSSGAAITVAVPAGTWIGRTTYTSGSGTFSINANTTTLDVQVWGAGGGGAGASSGSTQSSAGGGGGSGGFTRLRITSASSSYSYAVGAAASAATAGSSGTDGGDSTFGSLTAKGGKGGTAMTAGSSALRQAGGAITSGTTGGDINIEGGAGESGKRNSGTVYDGGDGADGPYGAGCAGRGAFAANGGNATGYGSGGGGAGIAGAAGSQTGGVAGGGLIIVDEYA